MATLGLSKVFILDKYFTELQKFWETEKKLQGITESFDISSLCFRGYNSLTRYHGKARSILVSLKIKPRGCV